VVTLDQLPPAARAEVQAAMSAYLEAGRQKIAARAKLNALRGTLRSWVAELQALGIIDQEQPKPDSPYLTAKQAARYLNVAYGTFRNWAYHIPKTRTGRYTREALDHFAATRKRGRK
jgi:hypothetical protein